MATKMITCKYCGKTVKKWFKNGYEESFCNRACYTAYRRKHAKKPFAYTTNTQRWKGNVKIMVTKDIDLFPDFKPTVGMIYDAEKYQFGKIPGYVVVVNGHRVCVRYGECEEVEHE